mgnify:FL=1
MVTRWLGRCRACIATALISLSALGGTAHADVPIINPGAPGQPVRTLSAEEATQLAHTGYSRDDVRFIQDMIPHHGQALEMAALVADRTNRSELIDIAGRINSSQAEIGRAHV